MSATLYVPSVSDEIFLKINTSAPHPTTDTLIFDLTNKSRVSKISPGSQLHNDPKTTKISLLP